MSGKVAALLTNPTVQSNTDIVGLLDDLLGGVYCLILARQNRFQDRPDRAIEISAVQTRADQVQRGDVRIDGRWIAGWYFNGALLRAAAVYHRLLKVVAEQPQTRDHVPVLRPKVAALYRSWTNAEWSSQHVDVVHDEVNTLKHTPKGVYERRTASFDDAVRGIGELLNLVEAWSKKDDIP